MSALPVPPASLTGFPRTHVSMVEGLRSDDHTVRVRAFDKVARHYWLAVCAYIHRKWRRDDADAQDLTQSFFLKAQDGDFFMRFDPTRARFRTYLRICVDRFVANELRNAQRLKRGGGAPFAEFLDDGAGEEFPSVDPASVSSEVERDDAVFAEAWVHSLITRSVEHLQRALESTGRKLQFAVFAAYDLNRTESGDVPTYAQVAQAHAIPITQVTNYLAVARREFRRVVLEELRNVTASEQELRDDLCELLQIDLES
jgi:DNA-directed RNA polymerase specialized sigma24 family protein